MASTHKDWAKAKTSRDMYARLSALAANSNRTAEAKAYCRTMLDYETEMDLHAANLDSYPNPDDT